MKRMVENPIRKASALLLVIYYMRQDCGSQTSLSYAARVVKGQNGALSWVLQVLKKPVNVLFSTHKGLSAWW